MTLRIVAGDPAGVTEVTSKQIGRRVQKIFNEKGFKARVKGLRFVPSTRVSLAGNQFQVVANTTVEFVVNGASAPRSETVDSVVTVAGLGEDQHLHGVSIPLLR